MAREEKKAFLKNIRDLTPTVKELVFEPKVPSDFLFKAGQFVMLHIPQPGKPVQRAYSVASPDLITKEFKLVIKFVGGGVASEWLLSLKGGEEVTYTGPFGKFSFREPATDQLIFVCTSTGLSPLYSMIMGQNMKLKNSKTHLYMGVWNEKEIFYEQELKNITQTLPNFKFNFVLDSPLDSNWKGLTGKVTDPIAKLDLSTPTNFYLCGNPHMIKAVKDLLAQKGFPADKIFTESYG